VAHALPLDFFAEEGLEGFNPHFYSVDLSINDLIRGGRIYAAFVFWSFLGNYAGMPHLLGQMHSYTQTLFSDSWYGGELLALRMLVSSEGYDLGEIFAFFVTHYRT